jgi:AbrB family looped-hinge helix DNA binding protein
MTTPANTHISSKGQVIIPKALRDANHWLPGTALVAEQTEDGVLLRPAQGRDKQDAASALQRIQARIGYRGKPVTVEQMNEAVLQEAQRRGSR